MYGYSYRCRACHYRWPGAKTATIYALVDPRNATIRWVGQTMGTADHRLEGHLAEARANHATTDPRKRWILEIMAAGLTPRIEVLEECHALERDAAEVRWMAKARADGAMILNRIAGGFNIGTNEQWLHDMHAAVCALIGPDPETGPCICQGCTRTGTRAFDVVQTPEAPFICREHHRQQMQYEEYGKVDAEAPYKGSPLDPWHESYCPHCRRTTRHYTCNTCGAQKCYYNTWRLEPFGRQCYLCHHGTDDRYHREQE